MHKKRKKEAEIEEQQREQKSKELDGCTFKPDLDPNRRSVSRKKSSRPSRSQTPVKDGKLKKSEDLGQVEAREAREAKFLNRIEEMKRRDEKRKERTRRKYEEMQRREFEQQCTFQPNKKPKSRKPNSSIIICYDGVILWLLDF